MTTSFKSDAQAMWASGDYHRFAVSTVWELCPVLVRACGIAPGQRVLDVAAGTGNVAIRAANAGSRTARHADRAVSQSVSLLIDVLS